MCKRNYARRLKSQGYTRKKIAETLGVSSGEVSRLLSNAKTRSIGDELLRKEALSLLREGFDRSLIVASFGKII